MKLGDNLKTGFLMIHYNDSESVTNLINNIKDYKILDRILIVDNHSNSKEKKKIKELTSKKISIIENKENLGFAAAINIGAKELIKQLGPCNLIISNADIIIHQEEDLQHLVKELQAKNVGMVAPTILENQQLNRGWKNPSPWMDSLLNLPYIHRFLRKKYIFYPDSHYQGKTSIVEVVSGCFFLIQSNTLEKIDFLDDNTFLYYEENIIAKKIQQENLKIIICNDILVIHNHSISIDKNIKKIKKLKLQKQSQYYFQVRYNHANWLEKFLLKATALVSRMMLTVVYFWKDLWKKKKK